MEKKVVTLTGELGRPVINEICETIHSHVGKDLVLIFTHTNIVLLEDYLVLVDVLNFARVNCRSVKAYFYGILNFKHVALMQSVDSTMGENSVLLIQCEDLCKLKPLHSSTDELIKHTMYNIVDKLAYDGNGLSRDMLIEEDMLLTKQGCIELGIIRK